MICSRCGFDTGNDARFCGACGAALAAGKATKSALPDKRKRNKTIGVIVVILAIVTAAIMLVPQFLPNKVCVIYKMERVSADERTEIVYTYNEDGTLNKRVIGGTEYSNGAWQEFTYNKKNKMITQMNYIAASDVIWKTTYKYNDDGKITEFLDYSSMIGESGELTQQGICEYDDEGQLKTLKVYSLDNGNNVYGSNVDLYEKALLYIKTYSYTDGKLVSTDTAYSDLQGASGKCEYTYDKENVVLAKINDVNYSIYCKEVEVNTDIDMETFMMFVGYI